MLYHVTSTFSPAGYEQSSFCCCFIIPILTGVTGYLLVAFLCISLMTNNVRDYFHMLFISLSLAYILCPCLLIVCFLLFSDSESNPLWDTWFVNIFSKSVTSLFILSTVAFREQKFLIRKSYLSSFSFMDCHIRN